MQENMPQCTPKHLKKSKEYAVILISNLKLFLDGLDGSVSSELTELTSKAARLLHVKPIQIKELTYKKRSIDARKPNQAHLLCTVELSLVGGLSKETEVVNNLRGKTANQVTLKTNPKQQSLPDYAYHNSRDLTHEAPIVVVGAGCAGLFCTLQLAKAGLCPILIEQGEPAYERTQTINHFFETGELDLWSNVQFGLGGAGTFSDGKLATGTKSPLHRQILETFVACGAPQNILWDAKPHIGSDILPTVVQNMVAHITQAGGEVHFNTKLVDVTFDAGGKPTLEIETRKKLPKDSLSQLQVPYTSLSQSQASYTSTFSTLKAREVILSCGHSARPVFELLKARNVYLERKTFAMGVRIEHPQSLINQAQYGKYAEHPALGAAPYKLVAHVSDTRSAFSFCMCPGGEVVAAASEPQGVVTNGMSLNARAGQNANAGLLANVYPTDLKGDDVLAGITLQRSCEKKAFELGGGNYVAPAQLLGDFLGNTASSAVGKVVPTYSRGVAWTSLESCLPAYVIDTLRAALPLMNKSLNGYTLPDAVLTGVETRSSAPVRITRTQDFKSLSHPHLWPCGEGAGYAGGIMSAANDGLRVANALIASLALC